MPTTGPQSRTSCPPVTAPPPTVAAAAAVPLYQLRCGQLDQVVSDAGYHPIIGVDEAGRGPLFGPLVAAAVQLPDDLGALTGQLDDSKQLTAARREQLAVQLHRQARVAVVSVAAADIDTVGIGVANRQALAAAARQLLVDLPQTETPAVLVDGFQLEPAIGPAGAVATWQIIKGDRRSVAVAAASIVAKTARDAWVAAAAQRWPEYGFERHKGYGTAAHRLALEQLGPTAEHRRTFNPLARMLSAG